MPITVSEKWDSREGTQGEGASTDLLYIIRGTDDDTEAKSALVAESPALYGGLIRQSTHIARIGEDTTAKVLVKKPIAVYVEQVYPTNSFSSLGIGT